MTPRQRDILQAIKSHRRQFGVNPTKRQLCKAVGIRSAGAIHDHLRQLERQGFLELVPPADRRSGIGLRLTTKKLPAAPELESESPMASRQQTETPSPIARNAAASCRPAGWLSPGYGRGAAWYANRNADVARRLRANETVAQIAAALELSHTQAYTLCRRIAGREGILFGRVAARAAAEHLTREIAALMLKGKDQSEIAIALGLKPGQVETRCAKISRALGRPSASDLRKAKREADVSEVERRIQAGETHRQIATALGKTSAWVSHVRAQLGISVRQTLHVSPGESEEMRRRSLAGESAKEIAHAMGVSASAVLEHTIAVRALRPAIKRTERSPEPPQAIGRKRRRRFTPSDLPAIETALRSGKFMSEVADDLGLCRQIVAQKSKPIRERLYVAGITCGCGEMIGHRGPCSSIIIARRRPQITARHLAQMRERMANGQLPRQIAEEMGFAIRTVVRRTKEIRTELMAEGITCSCGQIIGHSYTCSETIKNNRPSTRWKLSTDQERRVKARLISGEDAGEIAKRTGLRPGTVRRLRLALSLTEMATRTAAVQLRLREKRRPRFPESQYLAMLESIMPKLKERSRRYARRLRTAAADEVLQDILSRIWQAHPRFDGLEPLEQRFNG